MPIIAWSWSKSRQKNSKIFADICNGSMPMAQSAFAPSLRLSWLAVSALPRSAGPASKPHHLKVHSDPEVTAGGQRQDGHILFGAAGEEQVHAY